jgi:2-octaprenyl-6-methoxyphenol hydroxylase
MAASSAYDIVITGGGAVGLTLACALRETPWQVAVIEAVPPRAGDRDGRALALAFASQRILAGVGLWDRLAPAANPICSVHVSDRGHFGFARFEAATLGVPALGYVVPADALGAALLDAVRSATNIKLFCPAEVEALAADTSSVTVTVRSEGGPFMLRSKLLVAADGANSRTRTVLGIGAQQRDYRQTAIVTAARPQRSHQDCAFERFTVSGPLALLPLPDGRCGVVMTVPSAEAADWLALPPAQFLAELSRRFGRRLGRFAGLDARRAYPLRLVRARRLYADRAVLVGNAAHTVHPNAAQGLNLGLRDAAALAERLVQAARAGLDPGAAQLLVDYAVARRADQLRVVTATDGIARVFYNDSSWLVLSRDLTMLACDLLPPLKRALLRYAMGLGGRPPRLACGVPI